MSKNRKMPSRDKSTFYSDRGGSTWNKWDLHVHTPASIVNSYGAGDEKQTWQKYIKELESLPSEIRVLGINDYFFLDGYKRLLSEKSRGRLKNIELLLPVVELRLSSFAGHSDLRKVNFHIIFSNELSPDQIEAFLLRKLVVELSLENDTSWQGTIAHKAGLIDLGKAIRAATPPKKRTNDTDLELGFANAAIPFEQLLEALKESVFDGKHLRAVGLVEWDQMRWDGGSGAVKKNIINQSDLVLTCSPSPRKYHARQKSLGDQGVLDKLIDCSDAHYYSSSKQINRLGNVYTWMKADLSFRGLRRAIKCFDRRIHIADLDVRPLKLDIVDSSPGKYIQSIEIRKDPSSSLDEVWFDSHIPLNNNLVAIIGNQGNGKSALTDIIALCGNSKAEYMSFLTPDKFCDKDNKAGSFEASLMWQDGSVSTRMLDEEVDPTDYERVKYVPQGFFDAVTNEMEVGERGTFYREIKKVIFSHIPDKKRLGYSELDSLLDFHTDQAERTLSFLRGEIQGMNDRIAELEALCSSAEIDRLENAIEVKKTEISAYKRKKPRKVEEPQESSTVNKEIENFRKKEDELQDRIDTKNEELNNANIKHAFLSQVKQSIENKEREIDVYVAQLQVEFDAHGIAISSRDLVYLTIKMKPITALMKSLSNQISRLEKQLDPKVEKSLPTQMTEIELQQKEIEKSLETVAKAYQEYRRKMRKWNKGLRELNGTRNKVESLKWLESQLRTRTTKFPLELLKLSEARIEKCKEIFTHIVQVANEYSALTAPVHEYIDSNELIRKRFNIKFEIRIIEDGLADRLFGVIKHRRGTFSSAQDSPDIIRELIMEHDLSTPDEVAVFVGALLDRVKRNYKNDPPTDIDYVSLLRKGKTVQDLYNEIFELRYLHPEFSISLNDKPLRRLSPGERGILLLVFYLVVDLGSEPLIIDQPEGNLNNQSIFDNLVPIFHDAKDRRQLIIVTHNPNLAVVCDAEQIIHAEINIEKKHSVSFDCGALENPKFNKLSLDVLEGTRPAFSARRDTYEED